jgi:hypothetical protein
MEEVLDPTAIRAFCSTACTGTKGDKISATNNLHEVMDQVGSTTLSRAASLEDRCVLKSFHDRGAVASTASAKVAGELVFLLPRALLPRARATAAASSAS